jgi:uncharacterized membrane protein
MGINFINPDALWLLLLLPIVGLAFVGPTRLPRWRRWMSVVLRVVALLALVFGLAGTQIRLPTEQNTTLFLIDGSSSVSRSQRARAEAFVADALAAMPENQRAGIVVFGQQPVVERAPSAERELGQISARPLAEATNIQSALELGLSLFPAESRKRIVLLSDGGETDGDVQTALRLATSKAVPIDVVALSGAADGLDAQVSQVELPTNARRGQQLVLRATLDSSAPTTAQLVVLGPDNQRLLEQPIQLTGATQQIEINLPEPAAAFNRYVVRLELPDDARPENNSAEAFTFISGEPRVLLIEGSPGAATNLNAALQAARLDVTTVDPTQIPESLSALSSFEAVVLLDVPAREVSERVQAALGAYVHDLGRGLMMVGGEQSFGAGSWRETPVETALPVSMDIPSQFRLPPASITVLIDVSGSMGVEENGRTKVSLAAEGAARIASLMRDEDELTVIAFDSDPQMIVGPLPGSRRDEAIQQLGRMTAGGGGIEYFDGVTAAARYVRQSEKPVKHLITITDGGDTVQQEGALELIQQLRNEKVTVSTIAIGSGEHVPFIRDAAQLGGGRTFLTEQASDVPAILTGETQVVLQPYIVEERFTPGRAAVHPILRTINEAPALDGYVITTAKQTAQVLLSGPRNEPLLAVWQHGLGRSAAWTSDFRGQWGRDWVTWEAFPGFAAQLVGWLLPQQGVQNLNLQALPEAGALALRVEAFDPLNQPQPGLQVNARLIGGAGEGVDITLREIGPGEYRATVDNAPPGAYLVQVLARNTNGTPFGSLTAGAVVPPGAEFRRQGANPGLLAEIARVTGGRQNITPAQAFENGGVGAGQVREIGLLLLWLALLLLPFDIAIRRLLGLRRSTVSAPQPVPVTAQPKPIPTPQVPNVPVTPEPTAPKRRSKAEENLERLRQAQELARKRARGEE